MSITEGLPVHLYTKSYSPWNHPSGCDVVCVNEPESGSTNHGRASSHASHHETSEPGSWAQGCGSSQTRGKPSGAGQLCLCLPSLQDSACGPPPALMQASTWSMCILIPLATISLHSCSLAPSDDPTLFDIDSQSATASSHDDWKCASARERAHSSRESLVDGHSELSIGSSEGAGQRSLKS